MISLLPLLLSIALPLHAQDLPAEKKDEPDWDVNAAHAATHEVKIDVREGTWMSVSVHGDTVYFDLLGDLWKVPLAGGEAVRIAAGAAWETNPVVSPDGTKLAFVS